MTTERLIDDLKADEVWMSIHGEGSRYYVSSAGRVRGPRKFLKPSPRRSKSGGKITHYAVNIHACLRRVHALVLETFVGPRPKGMQACHFDGDPSNNRLENLRWDTPKANQADSIRHGTKVAPPVHRRGSNRRTWLNESDTRCISAEPYFRGVNQMLGRCFNVSYKTIERVRGAA